MNVVDKEQERIEKAKTPEGKKAKQLKSIATAAVVVIAAAFLYLMGHHPMFIGTPHIVSVGGISIEPGKTTVGELGAAGFFLSDFSMRKTQISGGQVTSGYEEAFSLSTPVDSKSYYNMLRLIKDGEAYASLSVVNESTSSKTLADCKVRSITVYATDEDAQSASVDGISMAQLSQESLIGAAGEPKKIDDSSVSDEKLSVAKWEKGNYSMELSTKEDGTVYSITSKYEKK